MSDDIPASDSAAERFDLTPILENMLWVANIRGPKTAWTWTKSPARTTDLWREARKWATGECLGLALVGPNHVGKTGIAVCAAMDVLHTLPIEPCPDFAPLTLWHILANETVDYANKEVQRRYDVRLTEGLLPPVYFAPWTQLEKLARASMFGNGGGLESFLFNLDQRVHLLVVDDIDLGASSPWREDVLYGLIERPQRGLRVILTLNRLDRIPDRLSARLTNPEFYSLLQLGAAAETPPAKRRKGRS